MFDNNMAAQEISDFNAEQGEMAQERYEAWVKMMEEDYGDIESPEGELDNLD